MDSITQDDTEVKTVDECEVEWCHEPVYEDGLCWDHWKAEKVVEWDGQDAERRACLEGVGYVFGDRYKQHEAAALWHELRYIYPDLAPPDERTPEERRRDAEKAKAELFG